MKSQREGESGCSISTAIWCKRSITYSTVSIYTFLCGAITKENMVHCPSCDDFPLYDEVQSFEIHMMDRYTFIHIIQCTIRGKSASKGK